MKLHIMFKKGQPDTRILLIDGDEKLDVSKYVKHFSFNRVPGPEREVSLILKSDIELLIEDTS